ncbi:MAG: hypothetical protein IPP71_00325 [Bacteroidetes bacterium]|nr:hypothetical protein [Bacteroidota bacterium]
MNTIDVKGNHFDKIGKGIIAHNASSSPITINENNEFYNVDYGIVIRETIGIVLIDGNNFNGLGYSPLVPVNYGISAITIQNFNDYATTNTISVSGNIITDSRIGIHALNIPNLSIGANLNTPVAGTGNTISFSKEKGQYHHGIWVENCNSAKIQSNTINSTEPGFYLEGITVYESTDALINMNTITDATVPVNVRGSCPDTEFHCNVFDNDAEPGLGVQLVAADLPPQGGNTDPWNNEWYGYDNSTLFGVTGLANSPFDWYYKTGPSKYNPYPASGTANPFGTSAPGSACVVQAATNDPDRDVRYAAIAEDSLAFTEYENEFIYKSKKYLFEQIYADTSLLTKNTAKDTTFSRFYSDLYVTNIGLFRHVDSLIMAKI